MSYGRFSPKACLALLVTPSIAWASFANDAAIGKRRIAETILKDKELPMSIEDLYAKVFAQRKSRGARRIRQAFAAINKNRFDTARKYARLVQKDSLFLDYGYYLEGESYLKQADRTKARKQALQFADRAIGAYRKVTLKRPSSPLKRMIQRKVAQAEGIKGRIQHERHHYRSSLEFYERMFQRLSGKHFLTRVPGEAVENYSHACKKKRTEICVAWIRKIVKRYPARSPEGAAILKQFPEFKNLQVPNYREGNMLRRYRSADRDDLAMKEALALYLDQDYSDALTKFQNFLAEFPQSKHRYRARFWMAKALEQRGEKEQAEYLYDVILGGSPLSYYGILASFASGRKVEAYIDATLPKARSTDEFLTPDEIVRLKRAERLLAQKQYGLAAVDLNRFRPRSSLSSAFLMYLSSLQYDVGDYLASFNTLGKLIQRGYLDVVSTYGLRLIFPFVYKHQILQQAKEFQVDSILVLSLIKQESAFRPDIVSSAGAAGLMQLMPFTAVDMDENVRQSDLLIPDVNLKLGTKYISRLISRFDGNIALALSGYNAGPTRAKRWKKKVKPHWGLLEYVESIPFNETRGYVSSIIRNYFWYSYRISGKRLGSLDYFWGVSGPTQTPTHLPAKKKS